jgi:hypothetical protein
MYQKPTTTDSCHPNECKKSAINYLIYCINTYPLTQANEGQEQTIIKEILKKNGYEQLITNNKHTNKSPTDISQATQNTEKKKNGPPSHILALRPELLLTYFKP